MSPQFPTFITKLTQVPELSAEQQRLLQPVAERFAFRSNPYYNQLIDWSDPADPIRALIVPDVGELEPWGTLDASDEHAFTRVAGLQHKYSDTALLLVNDVCAAYCRFCFRKRLFLDDNEETVKDVSAGLVYISEHQEITNVLLTGGDPLLMATAKLASILKRLRAIDHVRIIRIGSKMPAFSPDRLLADKDLHTVIREYSTADKRIYVMAHFTHPREITSTALACLDMLQGAGAVLVNQTPVIRGVNDRAETLTRLFNELSYAGVPPYYVFQCRPTLGNRPFCVPLEEAYAIFETALRPCSGLARRARFVMSHRGGKVQVLGLSESLIFLKYLRAARPEDDARLLALPRRADAMWLDDYPEARPDPPVDAMLVHR